MKLHLLTGAGDERNARPAFEGPGLAALQADSVQAVAALYDRCHQSVRRLARRLLGDDGAAEDVVQEVFAALPRALRRFRGDADLQCFVLGIAVKQSRAHLRSAIRARRALARLAHTTTISPDDPERDAYRKQLARKLVAALDRIPVAQREAFVLCEVERLAATEAAMVLRIPEATVRTRLFHARARLRVLLADEAPR